jgi:hypothetical protein
LSRARPDGVSVGMKKLRCDLEQAAGNAEKIVGLLQQKYGYTRQSADEEFNRRMKEVKEFVD